MISKSFLKSSIIYTLGGALPMVAAIILLPFYSNLLDSELFVSLNFYISISLFFQILFTFSLDTFFGIKFTQLKDEPENQKKFVSTIANLLLIIGIILLAVVCLIGSPVFSLIFKHKFDVSFWPYGFLSILTAFFNAYFKTATNALIYFKKPGYFFFFNSLNFIATIAISLVGLYIFPNSLIGPISGRLLSGVLILGLGIYILKPRPLFSIEKKYLKEIFSFCSPYLFFVLFIWILGNIDSFFLISSIDAVPLAGYNQLLKCFLGIDFLQNSLSAVIFPKVFEIWNANKSHHTTKETNRYFNVFTALNIICMILFCICIPFFIRIFIPKEEYFSSFNYIGIVAAGYGLKTILNFYISTILFSKSINILLKIFGFAALIQIVSTYLLVNQFGLIGAIYAGIITKISHVVFSYLFTKPIFKYEFNTFKIYGLPALYLITNIILFIFFPTYSLSMYLSQLAFFTVIIYLIFKKEIEIVTKQLLIKK